MNIRLLILFLLTYFTQLHSQDVQINNIVATEIVASDNDVIEIEFIDQLPNLPFIIAWINESGKQYALRFVTSDENLIIPISNQESWKGNIGLVGLSINNVKVTIRKKNFGDHWSSFMTTIPLTPGSINFSGTYPIFGTSFMRFCLFLMILLTVILFFKFKEVRIALLVSFLISWAAYDVRGIKNRWDITNELATKDYQIGIFKELDEFLIKAREIIKDQPWSKEQLSGVLNSYCTYQLADIPYMPVKENLKDQATYVIVLVPKNREVVLNHGPYYLVKQ